MLIQDARRPYVGSDLLRAAYLGTRRLAHLRVNRFLNPVGAISGSFGGRYAWPLTFGVPVTDHPLGITTTARTTCPASPAQGGGRGIDHGGNMDTTPTTSTAFPVTPGETLTIALWVRVSVAGREARIRTRFRTAAPDFAWISPQPADQSITVLAANTWTRLEWTGVVPAGASYLTFRTNLERGAPGDWLAGETLDVTGVIVADDGGRPFFGGSTPARYRSNLTARPRAWEGAPTTVLTLSGASGGWGTTSQAVASIVASPDAPSGAGWVQRLTAPSAGVPTNGADVGYHRNEGRIAVTPGVTYTASVHVRPSQAVTLRGQLQWINSGGGGVGAGTGPITLCPAGVWTRLRATFAAPAGATLGRMDVDWYGTGNAILEGFTVDFDGYLYEAGDVLGDYFDGDRAPVGSLLRPAWAGTARQSASYLTARATPEWTGTAHASPSTLWAAG